MNKFCILLAIAIACIGLAGATFLKKTKHFEQENDCNSCAGFEHDFGDDGLVDHGHDFQHGGHGFHHGGHGFRHPGRHNHGGKFHHHHPHLHHHNHKGGKHFGRPHFKRFHHRRNKQHHHPHAVGGGAGFGAIGGFRGEESHLNGLHSNTHLGERDSLEGHSSEFSGGKANVDLDHHRNDHEEKESIRKHQLLNRDKTFIRDKTSGVNDVDGFRTSDSNSESSHFGAGLSGFQGSEAGGSSKKEKDFDHDLSLINAGEKSLEAGGAFGAGLVGGAIH